MLGQFDFVDDQFRELLDRDGAELTRSIEREPESCA
jgi:hypothetical protein